MKHKVSVASYLSDAIERCGKTHRQIAAEAGFPRPYAITTVKSGRTKVPITKVPSLAKVLDIDAKHLLELCFRQYEPGYWEVIEAVFRDSRGKPIKACNGVRIGPSCARGRAVPHRRDSPI